MLPPLRVKEAAKLLNVSAAAIYDLIRAGKLPHYRIGPTGRTIRVSESAIEDYLTDCQVASVPPPIAVPTAKKRVPVNTEGFKCLRQFGFNPKPGTFQPPVAARAKKPGRRPH